MARRNRSQSKYAPPISRSTASPSNASHRTATAFDVLAEMPAGIFDAVKQARQLDKIGAMAATAIGNTTGSRSPRKHTKLFLLLQKLTNAPVKPFAVKSKLDAPSKKGVYVIYGPTGKVLHVGSTTRGKDGLAQRLQNHRHRASSFTKAKPKRWRQILNGKCKFSYLVVNNDSDRARLEALAIGTLWPEHIGTGQLRALKTQ